MTYPTHPSTRAPRRKRIAPRVGVGVLVIVLGLIAVLAAQRVWYGTPYPAAAPRETAAATHRHAVHVHDVLGLQGQRPRESEVERRDSSCYTRGLRALTNWDAPEPGVYMTVQDWQLEEPSERRARAMLGRLRAALTAEGWEVDTDHLDRRDDDAPGFSLLILEESAGWRAVASWEPLTGMLDLTVTSPCTRSPSP